MSYKRETTLCSTQHNERQTMSNAINSIEIRQEIDTDPDLSWLDQTDEQMGAGFEKRSAARKASYGDDWHMVGVYAIAGITVRGVTQAIETGGLWGTESDSDASHFAEIAKEQYDELAAMLRELGFTDEQINEHAPADPIEISGAV